MEIFLRRLAGLLLALLSALLARSGAPLERALGEFSGGELLLLLLLALALALLLLALIAAALWRMALAPRAAGRSSVAGADQQQHARQAG